MKNLLKLKPYTQILLSFAIIILIGAFLLMLPISNAKGTTQNFLDALFTATSAACVTGLVVNDINTTYTMFGKLVILILIQLGGLGILTFSSMLLMLISNRMGYYTKKIVSEDINFSMVTEVPIYLKKVSMVVFGIEFVGAFLLLFQFIRLYPLPKAIFYSIFHSISAFCNAGFSLFNNSLEDFSSNIIVNIVIISLILLGGIGFAAILDIYNVKKKVRRHLTISTRLGIIISIILIIVGAVPFFVIEYTNVETIANFGIFKKILVSMFQSITTRTAGFNTVNLTNLRIPTVILFLFLMFVGASPGSTGGGIKTTTMGIMLIGVWCSITGRQDIEYRKRKISWNTFNKAVAIIVASIMYIFVALFIISIFETDKDFIKLLFELVSAFGTVGLSMGITADLSIVSKLIIILTMFIGRIGPLTIMLALSKKKIKTGKYKYPDENVLIG